MLVSFDEVYRLFGRRQEVVLPTMVAYTVVAHRRESDPNRVRFTVALISAGSDLRDICVGHDFVN